jgi:hypothetical protein
MRGTALKRLEVGTENSSAIVGIEAGRTEAADPNRAKSNASCS